jgi:aminodeoxyfutalosine synthase
MRKLVLGSDIGDIIEKVEKGERLSFDEGVRLFQSKSLLSLGWAANLVRRRLNGNHTYYVVNRHINYTNICKNRCLFCAFSKSEGEEGAYTMSVDEIVEKAESVYQNMPFTELHLVGGLNPCLPLEYYTEVLSALKNRLPSVHIQAFTAVEIHHIAETAGLTVRETLLWLKEAGLGSLPGGGAEIFSPRVRKALCPQKLSSDGWLNVMKTAHELGIRSNATMLYGHIETPEEIVDHMIKLRELQDQTGGFLAFVPLAYHSVGTMLGSVNGMKQPSGTEDLRIIAVARLMLDNFPHIKAFWIMLGPKLAQVSLHFGADDFDGTVVEEKITHSAGAETPQGLTVSEIRKLIEETGTIPIERDTLYNIVNKADAV